MSGFFAYDDFHGLGDLDDEQRMVLQSFDFPSLFSQLPAPEPYLQPAAHHHQPQQHYQQLQISASSSSSSSSSADPAPLPQQPEIPPNAPIPIPIPSPTIPIPTTILQPTPAVEISINPESSIACMPQPAPVSEILKQIKQNNEQSGLLLQPPPRLKRSTHMDEELAWSTAATPYKKRTSAYRLTVIHSSVGTCMEKIHTPLQIRRRLAKTNESVDKSFLIYMYPFGGVDAKDPLDNVCCMDLAWPEASKNFEADPMLASRLHRHYWDSDDRAVWVHTVIIPIPEHRPLHEFRSLIDSFLQSVPHDRLRNITIYFEISRLVTDTTRLARPPTDIALEQVVFRRTDERYSNQEFGCVAHLCSLERIRTLGLVGAVPGMGSTYGRKRLLLPSLLEHPMPALRQIRLGADLPPAAQVHGLISGFESLVAPPKTAAKPKQHARVDPQATTVSSWDTMMAMTASPGSRAPRFPVALTVQLPDTVNKDFLQKIAAAIISNPLVAQQFSFFQCQSKRSAKYLAQAIIQASRRFVANMMQDNPTLVFTTLEAESRAFGLAQIGLGTMLVFDVNNQTNQLNQPFRSTDYYTFADLEAGFASQRFLLD